MIITRTPYRVSFFGGGTDFPAWYGEHGASILTTTLNKYCYLGVRLMPPFLGSKYRLFWSRPEMPDRLEDIEHPGIRGCLGFVGEERGLEVNHMGDLPARSGLGSSSAFTCGMLLALRALRGEQPSPRELATDAVKVEQDVLQETVGIQDQIACAYGGFNVITIARSGEFFVDPVKLSANTRTRLNKNLMLFFTGLQRDSSEIAKSQVEARNSSALAEIARLVTPAYRALLEGNTDEFGRLLHETWLLKRALSEKVSNSKIDEWYAAALDAGALGGKVLGAGGGGFMLFYADLGRHEAIRAALSPLIDVPFCIGEEGSTIILHEGS